MRTTLQSWLGHPALNATHWNLAHLPITAGGLGLPDLQALALAACTAALATVPDEGPLAAYKEELLARESPALLAQLQARLAHPVAELAGHLLQMPEGKSTRQLSRKLMHSIHLHSVRTQGEQRARCRQPCGTTGHATAARMGAWPPPHTQGRGRGYEPPPATRPTPLPTRHSDSTLDTDWVWTPQGRVKDAEGRCDWTRSHLPRALGHPWFTRSRVARRTNRHRHDELTDHLAQYARSSGVTATIEQARPADDAPRHARPMHTADVRMMDTEANTTPDRCYGHSGPANQALYGEPQGRGNAQVQRIWARRSEPSRDQGLVPFVIEQHGRPAPCAQAVADYLISKKARHMESTLGLYTELQDHPGHRASRPPSPACWPGRLTEALLNDRHSEHLIARRSVQRNQVGCR